MMRIERGTLFVVDGVTFEYSHYVDMFNEHICYKKTNSKHKEAFGFPRDYKFPMKPIQTKLF